MILAVSRFNAKAPLLAIHRAYRCFPPLIPSVQLADFIAANSKAILADWITFAGALGIGHDMDRAELRDHAAEMLTVVATDLRTFQSDAQQMAKSHGLGTLRPNSIISAAERHGTGRAESGFTLTEMVSEFRALRASVLRLWANASGALTVADLQDMIRFNEAIDQALAESASRYADSVDFSREMFIAMLAHDLRTPLAAIVTSSQALPLLSGGHEVPPVAARIERCALRMEKLIDDLLTFAKLQMGTRVPITRALIDLSVRTALAVDEVITANPAHAIFLETTGDLCGRWDGARLHQALTNLLSNAIQHGNPTHRITVAASGELDDVCITVHNVGPTIAPEAMLDLFRPFKRLRSTSMNSWQSTSIGIGLYITERIVTAHEGTIQVTSSNELGTTFTIRLPRCR